MCQSRVGRKKYGEPQLYDVEEFDMTAFTPATIKAVAEQSWWSGLSPKTIAKSNRLTEEQIHEIRSTLEYKRCVFVLMLGRRSSEEFEKWIRGHEERFARRMGLDRKVVAGMIEGVRQAHVALKAL